LAKHLQAAQRSELTITEYTRHHRLTVSGFYKWRQRLAANLENPPTTAEASVLVPAALDSESASETMSLTVHFPNGCRIELPCQRLSILQAILRLADAH